MKKHKPVAFVRDVLVKHFGFLVKPALSFTANPDDVTGAHRPLYSREQMEDLRRRHYKATKLIAKLRDALLEASTSQDAQRIATDGLCQYLGYRDHRNDPGYVMDIEPALVPLTAAEAKRELNAAFGLMTSPFVVTIAEAKKVTVGCIHNRPWNADCADCQAEATVAANADATYKKEADALRANICPHGADLRYFGCFKCSCQESEDMARQCGQDDKSEDQTNDEHKGPYPDW